MFERNRSLFLDILKSTSRPAYDNFLAVGVKAKIPPARCRELYEQVRENIIYIGAKNCIPYFATPVSLSFKEFVSRSMPLKLRPSDNFHVSFMPMALDVS